MCYTDSGYWGAVYRLSRATSKDGYFPCPLSEAGCPRMLMLRELMLSGTAFGLLVSICWATVRTGCWIRELAWSSGFFSWSYNSYGIWQLELCSGKLMPCGRTSQSRSESGRCKFHKHPTFPLFSHFFCGTLRPVPTSFSAWQDMSYHKTWVELQLAVWASSYLSFCLLSRFVT